MDKIKCDVAVVGAGPGGSKAAKTCAKHGLKTVLVERRAGFGSRRFAQVSHRRIFDYIKADDRFVDAKILGIKLISPDGTELEMHEPKDFELFFSIDRSVFDERMARLAVDAGAELMDGTSVTGLIRENGKIVGVIAKTDGGETEIRSDIVIDASGIESNFKNFKEADSCIEYLVDGLDLDRDYVHYRIGSGPFDYFYIVPKRDGRFAIDLFSTDQNSVTEDRMNLFIKENFPEAKVTGKNHVAIPLGSKNNFTDGMMPVGDSAGFASPFFRFGLLSAMDSGDLAGETAVEAHEEKDFSSNILSRYKERWQRLYGKRNDAEYEVRTLLKGLSEKDINSLFHLLKDENEFFNDKFFKKIGKIKKAEIKKKKLDEESLFKEFGRYDRNIWDLFVR